MLHSHNHKGYKRPFLAICLGNRYLNDIDFLSFPSLMHLEWTRTTIPSFDPSLYTRSRHAHCLSPDHITYSMIYYHCHSSGLLNSVMLRQVFGSLLLSYQSKAWLAPAKSCLFWMTPTTISSRISMI